MSYPWESKDFQVRQKLRAFPWYREHMLKIRPKEGGRRVPFKLNPAQEILDAQVVAEKIKHGRIRALVPKARRMGVSTYIGGRFFWSTATQRGRRAHVVAHRNDSAANLHREVRTFYEELPNAMRPSLGASNARELLFDKLQSSYRVSSAEGGDIGRSDDTHYLHFSEAAFFDNSEDLSSGIMQTVLDQPGTEIFMESTGNGASGMFYNMCEQANRERNTGLWRLHFLPWTVMPNYSEPRPEKWEPPKDFVDYARMNGLKPDQIYWFWRRNYEIATMNGGTPDVIHRITRQEYPASYTECFLNDSTLDFFPASLVHDAMLAAVRPTAGSLKIIAIDPAGDGSDKTWICDREGCAIGYRLWGGIPSKDFNVVADWIVNAYRKHSMDVICVDGTGLGKGLVDALRLRMRDLASRVVSINFGAGAHNNVQFGNRRAELHYKFWLWLQGSVKLPNDKVLQEECAAYKWGSGGCRRDELGRLFITPKEKIRTEIGRSPDQLDCVVTSFGVDDYALKGDKK